MRWETDIKAMRGLGVNEKSSCELWQVEPPLGVARPSPASRTAPGPQLGNCTGGPRLALGANSQPVFEPGWAAFSSGLSSLLAQMINQLYFLVGAEVLSGF